ncbi:hypothetical protein G3O08_04605 [Cryomorpha ignava]|uniref:Uncharacterized protein n=1 Tax=Cryomorpha ignava TaxID=101383 RepID=A0A7K3WMA2_9FLAO|nr:hypothetical protein [Cryomorpha ignava]NEN22780.1 hypothetical protein [Cryomorpha ignava]
MKITISGKDENSFKQVEDLGKKLGLRISKKEDKEDVRSKEEKVRSEKLYQLMTEMAKSGGIKSIPDPAAWQREIRKDRTLPGRE